MPRYAGWIRKLQRRRKRRPRARKRELDIDEILAWADAYRRRTGQWPTAISGMVSDTLADTWSAINMALRVGVRGLPGGSSLARLLEKERGVRNRKHLPALTPAKILHWADAYHRRSGHWPNSKSGTIPESAGETWSNVDGALRNGARGHAGGSCLARFLQEQRGVRFVPPKQALRHVPLEPRQILAWADVHYQRTGHWPTLACGPIAGAPGETWGAVDSALRGGRRGLAGRSSLPRLLQAERGVRHRAKPPPLTIVQILSWVDSHRRRTGQWPKYDSGPIQGIPSETWAAVDTALRYGKRGLRRGGSLAKLLARERGLRNRKDLPRLRLSQILAWADAHHKRTWKWPKCNSGRIAEAPGETWGAANAALSTGLRGLPGGSSLARLLQERRGVRNVGNLPQLSVPQILLWADAHHDSFGEWPTAASGTVLNCSGQTWGAVNAALSEGLRGLPGGSSLAILLRKQRRARKG